MTNRARTEPIHDVDITAASFEAERLRFGRRADSGDPYDDHNRDHHTIHYAAIISASPLSCSDF